VGTQGRKSRAAWVRRAEEGDLRRYTGKKKLRCVLTVKVRGAIGSMGACLLRSTRCDSVSGCVPRVKVRRETKEEVRRYAV